MSFFTDYGSDAKQVSTLTGFLPSVLLAQWSIETDNGKTLSGPDTWNFAGVTNPNTGVLYAYPSKSAGLYGNGNFYGYVQCATQPIYQPVRDALGGGYEAQCIALGLSAWAGSHYNDAGYQQGLRGPALLANAGISLIQTIEANNLSALYDGKDASAGVSGTSFPASTSALQGFGALDPGGQIIAPPLGLTSNVGLNDFVINGDSFDLNVTGALVSAALDLSMTQASTLTLTLSDPDHVLLNSGLFSEKAVVNFGTTALSFQLVSVEVGTGGVLTVTFEAYVVAALRTATGAITSAAGTMTRTAFADTLVSQVQGAYFVSAPDAFLYSFGEGYDRPTQEQISRGTAEAPLEDSWTCLQRLASEIDWVCFECLGYVYFGPYSWLAAQPPIMTPVEGQGGIDEITGTFDIGQSQGDLEITATADNWVANIGAAVQISGFGPIDGAWIVSEIERDDIAEPDITITVMQPQPQLPEPTTGGAQAAVGAGYANQGAQQSPGGAQAAKQALQYCVNQLGKPYDWGGDAPATGFDCSGLMRAAYTSAGVPLSGNTNAMWAAGQVGAILPVPPGIKNLKPGDLVFFAGSDPPPPGHVAMVSSVDLGTNDVIVIDAYDQQAGVRWDHFGYVQPGGNTNFAGTYFGALRPSP